MRGIRRIAVLALAATLLVGGCAGTPPPSPYGDARIRYVHRHVVSAHRYHHGGRGHAARRVASRRPHGSPESFAARTRARCRSGDPGACRIMRAIAQ